MSWQKEENGNNSRRSHSRSDPKPLDLKPSKTGTSRNPFINFLSEFYKITPTLKMSCAEKARIAGSMWRKMTGQQKAQFQILEGKRRRKRHGGTRKRRRRRRRSHSKHMEGEAPNDI